jgi:hypothetical protein
MATVKKSKKAQDGKEIVKGSRPGLGVVRTEKERTTVGGLAKPYKYTRTSVDTTGYSKGKPTYDVKTQTGEGDKTGYSVVKSNSSKKISRKEVPETLKSLKMKSGGSTPAWTRKEGKNTTGGLNAKGRASYNRANPGKPGLKAPQPEGGSRKKSFCARMGGMKKKLTSSKTANDPNSRINKSLRKWKC